MRYEVEIDGDKKVIELDERDDRFEVRIEDRKYNVAMLRPERDVFLLLCAGQVYEARAWPAPEASTGGARSFSVELRGKPYSARLIDRKHRRAVADAGETGVQYLTAPMPGKVVKVLLSQGHEVASGQGVLVVEAMKMQNEIKANKAGILSELRVKEGDAITAKQVLGVVEPTSS